MLTYKIPQELLDRSMEDCDFIEINSAADILTIVRSELRTRMLLSITGLIGEGRRVEEFLPKLAKDYLITLEEAEEYFNEWKDMT